MRSNFSDRAVETATPIQATPPDFEVEQMEGAYELGMHRQALASARRILSRTKLNADVFARTLILVLSSTRQLKPWKSKINQAWNRLPPRARLQTRAEMLAFRYSTDTLDQALPLATLRPRDASDLMFSLAAFIHHRRERPAHRLVMAAQRHLEHARTDFERATLLRAITQHHLERREWGRALHTASLMPPDHIFIGEQHIDMAAAVRGAAEDALKALDKLGDNETAVSHPGLDEALQTNWRRKLLRLQKSLAWTCGKPTAKHRA